MTFKEELERLINRKCMENESNTPDFILAEYMVSCLYAFEVATTAREKYYHRPSPLGVLLPIKP